MRTLLARIFAVAACLLTACQSDSEEPEHAHREPKPMRETTPIAYGDWGDPFSALPSGDAQRELVCAKPGDDLVRDVFCAEERAPIENLLDLELALGLDPDALAGVSGSAFTGHSTSLSTRAVSAINPRAILLRLAAPPANIEFVTLSFNRGDQFSEIAVVDRVDQEFRFYLVRWEQDCNQLPAGCSPGDLLTDAVEDDWRKVTLYDEQALANTVLDCATCHQPEGPSSPKILRMQEFDFPWTHWFYKNTDGGSALIDDYDAAKGEESIAKLPRDRIDYSPPGGLQLLVGSRNHDQPNPFDSEAIEREVRESAAQSGGNQPIDNRIPGISPTWREAYDRAQRGESIPVPYHDVKITDPEKLARMTEAYRAYRRGDIAREDLPDIRDVFPDDPQRLAEMGIMTEPGLSGEAVLIQACSQCHNDRLDQTQSRARFRANLEGMSRTQKDLAIQRLSLPANDIHAMPPPRLRTLSDEARKRAIEALQR
jgi:hypothetical protein